MFTKFYRSVKQDRAAKPPRLHRVLGGLNTKAQASDFSVAAYMKATRSAEPFQKGSARSRKSRSHAARNRRKCSGGRKSILSRLGDLPKDHSSGASLVRSERSLFSVRSMHWLHSGLVEHSANHTRKVHAN
jgi:hypothetical protein